MKNKDANMILSFTASSLIVAALILSACGNEAKEPEAVVKDFVLLCEAGKMSDAAKLLASKNNVDYFKKFQDKGKDMIFIDYDYKGNDDTIEMNFTKKNKSSEIAIVQVDTNYKIQQHKFSKDVILHNENGEWKIYEYPSLYPVKVK
ncbi:DUF4878 domain-containing protein [Campylobacter sp. RM9334]|uniref:DUF4878 domain-containing protein n=1 Tax=unclassified Campylobacter TaxID=2593542 RepID=UPI001BDA38B5|nr:DUF4878 domain-containing protein [Campylobacter sp. 2018MI13]MBT0881788.1 DUF4878 domain-containing protein [Campylobacter sp. 2018MI13]MBZ8007492.1 DUF4878 domain-containing protein [Campylobacter sp. RM9334]